MRSGKVALPILGLSTRYIDEPRKLSWKVGIGKEKLSVALEILSVKFPLNHESIAKASSTGISIANIFIQVINHTADSMSTP